MRTFQFLVTCKTDSLIREIFEVDAKSPEHAAELVLCAMTETEGWQGLEVRHAVAIDARR